MTRPNDPNGWGELVLEPTSACGTTYDDADNSLTEQNPALDNHAYSASSACSAGSTDLWAAALAALFLRRARHRAF